jgi:hypothetical protein
MLIGTGDIEAADDHEAAQIVRHDDSTCSVEIWNDRERVRVLTRPEPKPV